MPAKITAALESVAFRILDEDVRHCLAGALSSAEKSRELLKGGAPLLAHPLANSREFAYGVAAWIPVAIVIALAWWLGGR